MGAVLIAVLVILAITNRSHQQITTKVDYLTAVKNATLQSSWPILTPKQIPSGYQVTQARFEPESYGQAGTMRWYLGLQSDNGKFVSLWQSDGPTNALVTAASNRGSCSGEVMLSTKKWIQCSKAKPLTRMIYRTEGNQTIIVTGTVSLQELKQFALSLHTTK